MRYFKSVKDIGDLKAAVKEALEIKQNRFAHKALGKDRTLLMIFLQFLIAYSIKHPKGSHEPWHERHRPRRKPRRMETRNREGRNNGWRQVRTPA